MEDYDMEARHRKELKVLEGERRATVKKLKSTQGGGKKAKDAIEKWEWHWAWWNGSVLDVAYACLFVCLFVW